MGERQIAILPGSSAVHKYRRARQAAEKSPANQKSPVAMCRGVLAAVLVAAFCVAITAAQTSPANGRQPAAYAHAYYLFLAATPNGCEDCYIPLLLTRKSLEELKESSTADQCVLITTFERDSIWHYDGILSIARNEIEVPERKVLLFARKYRYQEVPAAEVLRLLENPLGKIPISRPHLPSKLPAGPSLQQLVADFRRP